MPPPKLPLVSSYRQQLRIFAERYIQFLFLDRRKPESRHPCRDKKECSVILEFLDNECDNKQKAEVDMKLEGFGIFVKDMSVMVRFYRDVLGLSIAEYYPTEENPTWVCFLIGNDRFQIGKTYSDQNNKFHPRGVDGSGVQFYIKVDNVDEMYKKIRNKVEIIDDIVDKPWKDREFTFKDLDGYLISFYSKL